MRNKYLYVLAVFLFAGSIFAQTTETFETETNNSTSFTDNSKVFNITSQAGGTFDIANFPGNGWNGTAADNKFIDNSDTADMGIPVQFTIESTGTTPFHLKSVYLFLSQSDLNPGTGSCTITGKKAGSTVFTATSSAGFNSNILVNNGYTLIDLASYGGANNSNTIIDEYVVTTTGTFEYVAMDAMKWEYDCSGLVAPTANAQIFCNSGTVANLVATGNSLKWYAGTTGGSPLAGTTALTTKTYYVTSSSTGCESARIPVSVTITPSSDNVTTVSACDSYTWNGTTYTTSGTKTGPTANCVTEKLNLTITPSSDNVTTVSACGSYIWNGTTYTTSGIKTGPTANCVTEKLNLTITPSSDNVTVVSACGSYIWNGTTYTTSGIKTGPTTNCVTQKLDLTINATPVPNAISNQIYCSNQVTNPIMANKICGTANEGEDIQLIAPAGFVFTSVPFASFGTPNGICDNFTLGSCHATNSVSIVEGIVLGQNSATISASNSVFGDPCGGTVKRLYVEAAYGTVSSWTNNTPSIGLAASGAGTIPSFTAVNSTSSPIVATITVVFNNGTCDSAPQTFTITINPSTAHTTTVSACDVYVWSVDGNTYTTSGNYSFVNGCQTENLELTINASPVADAPANVDNCGSYTLPALTVGNYFTAPNGGGTALYAGEVFTSGSRTIYVYAESGTTPNCTSENSFTVSVRSLPVIDVPANVTACDSYTLSIPTNGDFYSAPNGVDYLEPGTVITSSQTIYVWAETRQNPNCTNENSFVITILPTSSNTTTVSACDSYTWNGTTYTTSGIKTGLTTNCVTEKLDLTITPSSDNVTTVSACDSYTWNGKTYTTSGIKTGLTTNCVTEKLDLTITPSSNNVTTVSACDSYTWNGTTYTTSGIKTGPTANCVTQKLDLTITPSSDNVTKVSACDSYTWNGTTYTTSGIKTGLTTNCVTEKLDLTITASPIATVSLISPSGESTKLSADQMGASYQWIDCNNANTPIFGEINQSFSPTAAGTYSVIVTLGTCSVTSNCIVVSSLKVDGFDMDSFNFYPNPVKDNLYLSYSKEITSVKVFNLIGQALLDKSINATTANIEMSSLPSGTYFVEVRSLDSYKTIKVIKK